MNVYNSTKKYSEPEFWEEILEENQEPLYKSLLENFNDIKKELINLKRFESIFFLSYKTKKNLKNGYFSGNDLNKYWKIAAFADPNKEYNLRRRGPKLAKMYARFIIFFIRLLCPKTYSIIKKYTKNNIIETASFVQMSPHGKMGMHRHPIENGVRKTIYHLGIICDPNASITVGDKTKTWEEGKILAFKSNGPYRHSVIHNGEIPRIILFVEVNEKYLEKYGMFSGEIIKD
jgi:hypothetical protein